MLLSQGSIPMIDYMAIYAVLLRSGRNLYVLIDAAQSNQILEWLQENQMSCECLFSGVPAITLAECAPYLLPIGQTPKKMLPLLKAFWGKNCLLFLESSSDMKATRLLLKKFLQAQLPDGTVGIFRFYDPRVWRRYMMICTPAQRKQMFSKGISRYLVENSSHDALMSMERVEPGWLHRLAGTINIELNSIPVGLVQPAA